MGGIAKGIGNAVGSVVGGITGSNKAANAQVSAAKDSNQMAWNIYRDQKNTLAPFLKAGQGGLAGLTGAVNGLAGTTAAQAGAQNDAFAGLQSLTGLGGMNKFLNDYYNSDAYKQQAAQARYQNLASAEATGGLGSTATSNQLAAIAPQLGMQAYNQQLNNYQNLFGTAQSAQNNAFNQLLGLSNIGLSAGGAQNAAAGNFSNTYGQNMGQIGAARAGASLASGNALTSGLGYLAGTKTVQNLGSKAVSGIGSLLGGLF